ncbi:YuiA family protein [Bacillus sp. HMF5848]|uniref:YuiA family protein n=1 Tax=Bacillus sp. HMF5848 TaxID=2495421 RepID=UPI001639B543|nr:YuiA family protein [Bacillus sp. HMF5848]
MCSRDRNYSERCPYCEGKGYFQLVLGGSETCSCCEGTGTQKERHAATTGPM